MNRDREDVVSALVGRYDVLSTLGRGGMATVYLAEDLRHHRKVAVKVLDRHLLDEAPRRFLREIEIAGSLVHPHIVPLYDSGRVGDLVFFVMPYLDGETLAGRIERVGSLPVTEALRILAELASALDCAHRHGVVHRDVKPANVMLTEGGAVLMDFGIARGGATPARPGITGDGRSVGTPEYMSPEQADGSEALDERGDLYALGCVAFEMLTGRPPFTGSSAHAVVARHISDPVPDASALRSILPASMCRVLKRALAKQPADRFDTALDFVRALDDAWLDASPAADRRRARRPMVAAAVVAGVMLLSAGSMLFVALDGSDGPGAPGPPTPRQLTFDGSVRSALGSPGGGYMAYEVLRGDTLRLFVADGDGGAPTEIYRSVGFACCPAWSPDGGEILIRAGVRRDGTGLLLPRRGGSPRAVPGDVISAWSPDGRRVVGWWPATDTLRFFDVDTGRPDGTLHLGMEHDWVNGVDWSPDGRFLAVVTSRGGSGESSSLWTVPLDGTGPQEIFRDDVFLASPHWAAGSDAVYFLRTAGEVWRLPVDPDGRADGEPHRLASGLTPHIYNPAVPVFSVSADGGRLHYARRDAHANLVGIQLASIHGTGDPDVRWLTSGTAEHAAPRLSPDASRLVVLREGPDGWSVWAGPLDGDLRRLTYLDGAVASPDWSPDGAQVVFGRPEDPGVWLVDVARSSTVHLGGDDYGGHEVIWLGSGTVLYQKSGDRSYGLLEPDGGPASDLTAPDGVWLYGPRSAPDGSKVAFRGTGARPGLWVVDVARRSWVRATDRALGPVAWTATGDTVYAMPADARRGEGSRELYAVAVDDGAVRLVGRLPEGMAMSPWSVSMDPDLGILVGAVEDVSVDAWVLEGFDSR